MAKAKNRNRKYDRNRKWCEAYRNAGKHEKSQGRQLARHLEKHPGDEHARGIYDALPAWAKRAPKVEAA